MTKDDLEQIGKLIDDRLDAKLEPVKRDMATKGEQAHITTAIEAVKAGLDDVREKMATEAGVMDVGAKIDRVTRNHERRIEELEKQAGLTNPFKN